MKKIIVMVVFLFGVHLQSQDLISTQRTSNIDSITIRIDDYVKKNSIPALVVAINRGANTDYIIRGNTRRKNGLPISERSVFQIASLSKTFTAIIANNLLEQGLLGLKTPISKYLHEDLPPTILSGIAHITIEDILHHSAGFPHDGKSLPPTPNGAPQRELYTKDLLLQDLSKLQFDVQTEKRFSYSNFGYALLGLIMENVSRKTYETLLKEYVVKPYGLKNTYVVEKDVPKNLLAMPYATHRRELELTPWITGTTIASGGIFSSTEDLRKLMEEQLKAFKNYQDTGQTSPLLLTQQKEKISGALYYGFGMFESVKDGSGQNILTLGHGGDLDGYGSFYDLYPNQDLGMIMLTSSGGKEFIDFHDQLERILLGLPEKKEMFLSKQKLKKYEGVFEFESGQRIKIKSKGEGLFASGKGIPSLEIHAMNETTFFYKEFDGWYEFEIGEGGKISKANYIQYGETSMLRKVK